MSKHKSFKPGGNKRFTKFQNENEEKKEKLGHIPEEMMAYYRQVSATLEAGFDDDDPNVKREFLNNVYQALKDEGLKASQNQTVSRILETLFTHSEALHMRILFSEFSKDLTTVSFDRFASHVFQSLIQYLPSMYDDKDMNDKEKTLLKTSLNSMCQFIQANIEKLMTDTYGSHVLRSLLETLGGVHVEEEVIRSHISRNQRKDSDMTPKYPVSQQLCSDYKRQFENIKNNVITLCNFSDHLVDPNYCPVLQTALLILHKSNATEYADLAKSIMEKACPPIEEVDKDDVEKNLPAVVQDRVGSFLIELLVSLTSETDLLQLYKSMFKDKLIYFAVQPVANYVLQKFLSCITSSEILKEVVTDISSYLEDILAVNHIGVIVKLAEACKRNQEQQEELTKALMKAFHCDDPQDRQQKFVPLIAAMQTYDVFCSSSQADGDEEQTTQKPPPSLLKKVNIHGSLLLQQMVHFERPKHIMTSLLSLTPAELSNMASDQCGSHVVEAFFNSSTVWDRNKEEFLKKIKGFYINVACNKNGSRCLEGIWKVCSVKMKALIAEELIKSRERLESDRFGHFLYKNFALFKFATRKKDWMDIQSDAKKKQQMLQAILEGNTGKKKKNRKRKIVDDAAKENEAQPSEESASDVGLQNGKDDVKNADNIQTATQMKGKKRKVADKEIPDTEGGKGESVSSESMPKHKSKKNKRKKKKKKNSGQDSK